MSKRERKPRKDHKRSKLPDGLIWYRCNGDGGPNSTVETSKEKPFTGTPYEIHDFFHGWGYVSPDRIWTAWRSGWVPRTEFKEIPKFDKIITPIFTNKVADYDFDIRSIMLDNPVKDVTFDVTFIEKI